MLKTKIKEYIKETKRVVKHPSNERWYAPKGTKQWRPSVTTIINAAISKGIGFHQWLGNHPSYKIACEMRDIAANRGTAIHNHVEDLLNGKKVVPDSEEIAKYLMSFEKFYQEHEVELLATELFMWDIALPWAGTCDIICMLDNKLAIIDLKTGNYYKSHEIQLNMYKELFLRSVLNEPVEIDIYGLYVKGTWIKEPSYSLKKFKIRPDVSQATLLIWEFLNGPRNGKPWPKDKQDIKTGFQLMKGITDDSLF